MFKLPLFAALALTTAFHVHAADVMHVYGPGGPGPAMKEAAAVFGREQGIQVEVIAGPTPTWADRAKQDGALIFSGSEQMMGDFLKSFADVVDASSVKPLYMRPAGILVRPGNPRHIKGFADLLRPGVKIMVVNGAGQVGMWEDVAGRDGKIQTLAAFRAHISDYAANSGEAVQKWKDDSSIDAWLIFPIWSIAHPGLAQVVNLEPTYRVYRDCGIVFTKQGVMDKHARDFAAFLTGSEGKKIFEKYGWSENGATL